MAKVVICALIIAIASFARCDTTGTTSLRQLTSANIVTRAGDALTTVTAADGRGVQVQTTGGLISAYDIVSIKSIARYSVEGDETDPSVQWATAPTTGTLALHPGGNSNVYLAYDPDLEMWIVDFGEWLTTNSLTVYSGIPSNHPAYTTYTEILAAINGDGEFECRPDLIGSTAWNAGSRYGHDARVGGDIDVGNKAVFIDGKNGDYEGAIYAGRGFIDLGISDNLGYGVPGSVNAKWILSHDDIHTQDTLYAVQGVVAGGGRTNMSHDGSLWIESAGDGQGNPLAGSQATRVFTDSKGTLFDNHHSGAVSAGAIGSEASTFRFNDAVHVTGEIATSTTLKGASAVVTGSMTIPILSADPVSPANGQIWYNSTSGAFKCCAGGAVKAFTVQ